MIVCVGCETDLCPSPLPASPPSSLSLSLSLSLSPFQFRGGKGYSREATGPYWSWKQSATGTSGEQDRPTHAEVRDGSHCRIRPERVLGMQLCVQSPHNATAVGSHFLQCTSCV